MTIHIYIYDKLFLFIVRMNVANHDCNRVSFLCFVVVYRCHVANNVQDNRLRVERDELQHAAQEAEKTAALRKEVAWCDWMMSGPGSAGIKGDRISG